MHTRPGHLLVRSTGLALAALVLAGCGGGNGGDAGGGGSSSGGDASSGSSGSGSDGDRQLCGEPTTAWMTGLRELARADPADPAAYDAAVDRAVQDTRDLAGRAQDTDLQAAYTSVADGLADLGERVAAGDVDTSDPVVMLRAGADAVAAQGDVAEACLALGAG